MNGKIEGPWEEVKEEGFHRGKKGTGKEATVSGPQALNTSA